MKAKAYFWIAIFLATSCQFAWGDIIYVKQGASGTGTSWETNEALGNLSTALNKAVPNQDQVWVAQGTYSPPAGGSFVIPNNVAVIGGFLGTPGTEGQSNARVSDALMNNTILTGIGVTPQSRTIVTLLNSDSLTEFSSFQITGATESALLATDSQAVISDVLFLNNNATFGSLDGAAVTISGPLSTTDLPPRLIPVSMLVQHRLRLSPYRVQLLS